MSDCRCSGSESMDWSEHGDYCPVYMRGRIKQLEAENSKIAKQLDEYEYHTCQKLEATIKQVRALHSFPVPHAPNGEKAVWLSDIQIVIGDSND